MEANRQKRLKWIDSDLLTQTLEKVYPLEYRCSVPCIKTVTDETRSMDKLGDKSETMIEWSIDGIEGLSKCAEIPQLTRSKSICGVISQLEDRLLEGGVPHRRQGYSAPDHESAEERAHEVIGEMYDGTYHGNMVDEVPEMSAVAASHSEERRRTTLEQQYNLQMGEVFPNRAPQCQYYDDTFDESALEDMDESNMMGDEFDTNEVPNEYSQDHVGQCYDNQNENFQEDYGEGDDLDQFDTVEEEWTTTTTSYICGANPQQYINWQ